MERLSSSYWVGNFVAKWQENTLSILATNTSFWLYCEAAGYDGRGSSNLQWCKYEIITVACVCLYVHLIVRVRVRVWYELLISFFYFSENEVYTGAFKFEWLAGSDNGTDTDTDTGGGRERGREECMWEGEFRCNAFEVEKEEERGEGTGERWPFAAPLIFVLESGTAEEVTGCVRDVFSSAIRISPPKGMGDGLVRGTNKPDQDRSELWWKPI